MINNQFVFSETQVNSYELQKYRIESDSVLSFVDDCCEMNPANSEGSTMLFNAYRIYCNECGLKPYSQKKFVQQLKAAFPNDVTSHKDKIGKRCILSGIKLGEIPE